MWLLEIPTVHLSNHLASSQATSLDLLLLRTGAEITNIIPINRITTRKINKVCIVGGHNGEVPRDIGRRIIEDGTCSMGAIVD